MIVRNTSEATNRARTEGTFLASQWGLPEQPPVGNNDNSSASSTPFVSAPSSPKNSCSRYSAFFASGAFAGSAREAFDGGKSAVKGGVTLASMDDGTATRSEDKPAPSIARADDSEEFLAFSDAGSDFDFSARLSEADGSIWSPAPMSSADELFYNGQIRPLQLFSPIQLERGVAKPTASRVNDGFFDFRSSANYTLPSPRSPAVPSKQAQRKQGFGLTKPPSQVGPSALDQLQKVVNERGRRASTDDSMRRIEPTRVKAPVASERTRRSREGSHRRARSLSPLRVFHIDDQPRPSFESVHPSSDIRDTAKNSCCKAARERQTKAMKGWTLKELLHEGDSRICESSSAKGEKCGNKSGEKSVAKEDAKKTARKATPVPSPSGSRSKSARSKQAISPHELHYTSQRAQAEQMRKRTSLPYKQGLMGCLGFSSKNYRSFPGLHTLNPS